jgi:hypothetical protein
MICDLIAPGVKEREKAIKAGQAALDHALAPEAYPSQAIEL